MAASVALSSDMTTTITRRGEREGSAARAVEVKVKGDMQFIRTSEGESKVDARY